MCYFDFRLYRWDGLGSLTALVPWVGCRSRGCRRTAIAVFFR